jgi:hypothetical protein
LVTIYPGEQGEPEWAMFALIGIMVIVICAATSWNWNAPTRALRGRGTVGPARTAAEARALAVSQISYGQLAIAAGAGVVVLLKISTKHDLLSGWNRLWLAGAALLMGGAALQAYRKWRFERSRAGS